MGDTFTELWSILVVWQCYNTPNISSSGTSRSSAFAPVSKGGLEDENEKLCTLFVDPFLFLLLPCLALLQLAPIRCCRECQGTTIEVLYSLLRRTKLARQVNAKISATCVRPFSTVNTRLCLVCCLVEQEDPEAGEVGGRSVVQSKYRLPVHTTKEVLSVKCSKNNKFLQIYLIQNLFPGQICLSVVSLLCSIIFHSFFSIFHSFSHAVLQSPLPPRPRPGRLCFTFFITFLSARCIDSIVRHHNKVKNVKSCILAPSWGIINEPPRVRERKLSNYPAFNHKHLLLKFGGGHCRANSSKMKVVINPNDVDNDCRNNNNHNSDGDDV